MENFKKLLFEERIKDLQKYTLGELIIAINKYHNITPIHVGRNELLTYPMKKGKTEASKLDFCGGPAFIIVYRDEIISKEDKESIKNYA